MHAGNLCDGNHLLESLGDFIPYRELGKVLSNEPLKGIDVGSIPMELREQYIDLIEHHIAPTTPLIEAGDALQRLHRKSYVLRNPANADFRRRQNWLISQEASNLYALPWAEGKAGGAIFNGVTGMGKSTNANRYTAILPCQVRLFENGEIPGFHSFTQLVWLKVGMSSDGSKKGFLQEVVLRVDAQLGTQYYRQYVNSKTSVDSLLVVVAKVLSMHCCGMLIIDEINDKNFAALYSKDFIAFFLRLLNSDIPIVLIGNSGGQEEFEDVNDGKSGIHTQTTRRWSAGGFFTLDPYERESKNFKDLCAFICKFNLMNEPVHLDDAWIDLFFQVSGGIPAYLQTVYAESMRWALRLGKDRITHEDVLRAFESPQMRENQTMVNALVKRDLAALLRCTDVPYGRFARMWSEEPASNHVEKNEVGASAGEEDAEALTKQSRGRTSPLTVAIAETDTREGNETAIKSSARQLAAFKSWQKRRENREKKESALRAELKSDDVRANGGRDYLLAGFKEVLEQDNVAGLPPPP